jgi:hypothetical protein
MQTLAWKDNRFQLPNFSARLAQNGPLDTRAMDKMNRRQADSCGGVARAHSIHHNDTTARE